MAGDPSRAAHCSASTVDPGLITDPGITPEQPAAFAGQHPEVIVAS